MVGDPIADMFSRINNAYRAGHKLAVIPYSEVKMEIAKLLKERGFAGEIAKRGKKNRRNIELGLVYEESGKGRISQMLRVSKPSRRIYKGWRDVHPVKGGTGFYVISTPAGIMDDKRARSLKVGGEILGEVW